MAQILNSGKDGNQRCGDLDLTKYCPALDDITLLQNLQNAYEETQGYSLGNNKGNPDSIDTNLDDITEANVSDYNKNLAQLIQTYVANGSYLDVDPASTANNIILTPRKIADIVSPNGVNFSKPTSLPFTYRDNLRFVFRATLTNTGATQFSIKDNALAGLVGAKDVTTETGANLIGGEIIAGKFYTIVLTGTGGVQKAVLIITNLVPQATQSVAGIAVLPKQITIANNVSDANNDIDFSAGNFQFDDGSGQAALSAATGQLDVLFGTGNGMLDVGTKANNTAYYLFAIYNPTTGISKPLCSASKTSPTMPSGYTKKTYVGALRTDGSGNIRTGQYFYGKADYRFIYNQPVLDVSETPAATTVQTKNITAPALTFPIMPVYLLSSAVGGGNRYILLTTTSATDIAPDSSNFDVAINQGGNEVENNVSLVDYIQLSTSSTLRYRVNTTACTLNIITRGWTEYLN